MMDEPIQLNLFAIAVVVAIIVVALLVFSIRWFKPPAAARRPKQRTAKPPKASQDTAPAAEGADGGFDLEGRLKKSPGASPGDAAPPPAAKGPMTAAPAPAAPAPPVREDPKATNVFSRKRLSGVIVPPRRTGAKSHSPEDADDVLGGGAPPSQPASPAAPDVSAREQKPPAAPVEAAQKPAPASPEPVARPDAPAPAPPAAAPPGSEAVETAKEEAPPPEFQIRDRDAPVFRSPLDPPAPPVAPPVSEAPAKAPEPVAPAPPAPEPVVPEPVAAEPAAPEPIVPEAPTIDLPEAFAEPDGDGSILDALDLPEALEETESLGPLEPLESDSGLDIPSDLADEMPEIELDDLTPEPPPELTPEPVAEAEPPAPPEPVAAEPPEPPPPPAPAPPVSMPVPPIIMGAPPPPSAPIIEAEKPQPPAAPQPTAPPPQPPAAPSAPVVEADADDDAFEKQLANLGAPVAAAPKPSIAPPGFPVHAAEPEGETVDMKAFSPMTVAPRDPFIVQAVFHPEGKDQEAVGVASLVDPGTSQRASRSLSQIVQHGQTLTATLEVDGAEIDAPVQSVVWQGKTEGLQFLVEVPEQFERMSALAKLRVLIDGVSVGSAAWRIVVQAGAVANPDETTAHIPTQYRKAFVSYSSQDRAEVLKRVQGLQAAGIEVFQDVLDLEPGDRWAKELYKHIDEADAFYLFWSPASAKSEWVAKEWRYALDRAMTHPEKRPDICPVILTAPPPRPPQELADRHFNDIIAYVLAAIQAQG